MGLDIIPIYPGTGDGINATRIQGVDVSALAPAEGQSLVYDAQTAQYVPAASGSGGTLSSLNVSGNAVFGTINETYLVLGGSNLYPTIASDSVIYDDVDLFFAPKGYGQCVLGSAGWLYSTASSGAGSLLLNNGTNDSPNIKFSYSDYGNFGIDTALGDFGGPFSNLANQSLRFISQSDEEGGAVIAALDSTGNFAILGGFSFPKVITETETTGAQTINAPSGSVNFESAATSLVVTNSLVTVSSVIHVTKATNDAVARVGAVVADNGAFTIYMDVAPTTEIRVNFIVTN